MNEPMTDDRLDKLVRMVECGEWERLVDEWDDAGAPFGFLGDKCGCPSQVRHGTSDANLAAEDLQALRADPLIIDMDGDLETLRGDNARKIFQRYEHYQRLVTS